MNLAAAQKLARLGKLYPSLILHGADARHRQQAAVEIARCLLCSADSERRGCGDCSHCRRITWPEGDEERFHPDFRVLLRDLKTATSVEASRSFLKAAHLSPFEARGQVFVVGSADSLTSEAADSLLKVLEEPPARVPRHFLLLAPSALALSPTLRSRSLSIYLGAEASPEPRQGGTTSELSRCLVAYYQTRAVSYLLAAAAVLSRSQGWADPRAAAPWTQAAATVLQVWEDREQGLDPSASRPLLALAEDLLSGVALRVRGISPERILEGLVVRHLLLATPNHD